MTADEWRSRIDNVLRAMITKMDSIDHKLDQLLYEDDVDEAPRGNTRYARDTDDFISEEDILNKGQKVAYNKIVDKNSVETFRQFIQYMLTHEHEFTTKEVDYARFKENNDRFSDVRLSDNHRRILGTAFAKTHGRAWDFPFIRGTMFKYQGSIVWRWTDGGVD